MVLWGVGKLFWRSICFKCTLQSPGYGWEMNCQRRGKRTRSFLERIYNVAPKTITITQGIDIGVIAKPCVSVVTHRLTNMV